MDGWIKSSFNEKLSCYSNDNGSDFFVLMVHGFKGKKDFAVFEKISDHLNMIGISNVSFDFSGCGKSQGKYSKLTLEKQSKEILDALNLFKGKKAIIVAHSMGCCSASMACLKSKKIKALVFINPLIFPYITFADSLLKFSPHVMISDIDSIKIELPKKFNPFKKAKNEIAKKLRPSSIGKKLKEEIKHFDLIRIFEDLKTPVHIIHGKKDELIPISHSEYFFHNLKHEKRFKIIDSFHSPFLKNEVDMAAENAIRSILKLKEKFLK